MPRAVEQGQVGYRRVQLASAALAPAYRPFTSRRVTQYTWRTACTSGMAMTASARCRNGPRPSARRCSRADDEMSVKWPAWARIRTGLEVVVRRLVATLAGDLVVGCGARRARPEVHGRDMSRTGVADEQHLGLAAASTGWTAPAPAAGRSRSDGGDGQAEAGGGGLRNGSASSPRTYRSRRAEFQHPPFARREVVVASALRRQRSTSAIVAQVASAARVLPAGVRCSPSSDRTCTVVEPEVELVDVPLPLRLEQGAQSMSGTPRSR